MFLPIVMKRWSPMPYTLSLKSVSNPDQDNTYTVSWASTHLAQTHILEEVANSSFSGSRVVYQGPSLSWTVPSPGKTPADYHYRVRALNSRGDSSWSNVRVVTIHPLFVGLQRVRFRTGATSAGSASLDQGSRVLPVLKRTARRLAGRFWACRWSTL